jgi:hypothetical protein
MMNEIPTKTRTGERTEPFLMVGQKKSRVDSGPGNLPSLRRPERTNQPPELVKRVGKVFGRLQDAWPCVIPGLDLVDSVWLPW